MPQAMNKVAKRFGHGIGLPLTTGRSPQTGIDSSQGRDIATPAPRRKVRREREERLFGMFMVAHCGRLLSFPRSPWGTHVQTLRVVHRCETQGPSRPRLSRTQSVRTCVPTRSVGTRAKGRYLASPRLFKNCWLITIVSISVPNR